jgi:hypothetical protein
VRSILPEADGLPKEVVARPVEDAGSSLLLKVSQERMAQLVGSR